MRQSRPQLLWVSPQTLPRSRMQRDFRLRPPHSRPYQKATEEFCGRAVVCPRVLRFCCARAFECSEIPAGLSTSSRNLNLICMLFVWMHVRTQIWKHILRGLTAISIFAPIARPIPSHVMASYWGSWGLYLFICSFKASVFGPRRMSMCIPPSSPSPSPIHADIRPSYYITQSLLRRRHRQVLTSTMKCSALLICMRSANLRRTRWPEVCCCQLPWSAWSTPDPELFVKVFLGTHASPTRQRSQKRRRTSLVTRCCLFGWPKFWKLGPWLFFLKNGNFR
jgi:hypothetical protein